MFQARYPHLFSPLKLHNRELRNRIIVAPTGVIQTDSLSERVVYYEEKARGGAAVVTVGQGYVDTAHGSDLPKSGFAVDTDNCIPQISAVADAIRKHGAIASIELSHAGMNSFGSHSHGNEIYAPVDMEIKGGHSGANMGAIHVKEATDDVIEEIIQKHVNAAVRAKRAGYEMVLIHGGHGWLIHQFISPIINTRTDKWGGSMENRMRLPIEICDRIKDACGKDFLIDFRMSVAELGNGYGTDVGIQIAKAIDGHVDLIHASCGNHEGGEAFVIMHPSMFLEDGCNRHYAELIKPHVKTPVVTVGAFSDPELMEKVLAEGKADAIAIARGIIADPQLPNKARAGKASEINQCLRCYECYSTLIRTSHYYCAINPSVGHEQDFMHATPISRRERVLVAGGGIAGMEAALTAADRGHDVVLLEKGRSLGGVLLCEDKVPFKSKQTRYIAQQARRVMEHPSITVHLETPVSQHAVDEASPDAIIAAIGSVAKKPTALEGACESKIVADAEDVYRNIEIAGNKVVVVGGGLTACEIAIYLAQNGRDVKVLVRKPAPRIFDENMVHGEAIMAQFSHLGIEMLTSTPAKKVTEAGVLATLKDGSEQLFEADTVICPFERTVEYDVLDSIRNLTPEFYIVGDAVVPKNIRQAVTQGYYAAMDLGRDFR